MSDPLETPWSSHPNAPKIPFKLYLAEKESLIGLFIAVIFYGAPARSRSSRLFDRSFQGSSLLYSASA